MNSKQTPRILQQQPDRPADRQQQQSSGSGEFQPKQAKDPKEAKRPQQMGEGSYEATADYQKNIKNYLEKADVKADALAAKPASKAESDELQRAEKEGLSHSKARGQ
jgi:ribosome-binding protein aMBF1 (putative translation factor)